MNICVFCSANDLSKTYTRPAAEFAKLIAKNGYTLVWGGSNHGLMKTVADGAQSNGGKIVGISFEFLRAKARKNADEMIIAKDLTERKATMLKRSDVIVVMVGGLGTLDEVTEILELKKHNLHNKPVIVLSTNMFYEGLEIQLEKMNKEGFLPRPLSELIYFASTPKEAMDYIKNL